MQLPPQRNPDGHVRQSALTNALTLPTAISAAACGGNAGRNGGPRRGRIATAAGRSCGGSGAAARPAPGMKTSSSRLASEITIGGVMPSDVEGRQRRMELPLAAVDQQDVGRRSRLPR